jgi:hypothetical protein
VVRTLLRPASLLAPLYGSDRITPAIGDFYVWASSGSVTLPTARYDYNSDWTPLLAGLSPAGMAASFAAPTLTTGRYGLTRAGLSPAGLRQPHWRFREFHPEPLTDPYVKASRLIRLVPSREGCRLPLNEGLIPAYRLAQSNGGDPPPSLELHDKAFITYMMVSVAETPGRDDPDRQGRERRAPRRGDLGSATRSPNPQGLPSSPVQLRSAVWTGVTRDTGPLKRSSGA